MLPRAFLTYGGRLRALALLAAAAVHLCSWAAPAAVAPAPTLRDYHHTGWSADDGAPAAIRAMAQTTDGWLWLGTLDGLFRFDGVQFYRYPLPPGLGLNRNLIRYLQAGPRGELYIGRSAEGISVLEPGGRLRELPPGPGRGQFVDALAVDADGSVWIVSKGIHVLREGRWQTVQQGPEWSALDIRGFRLDAHGQLWLARNGSTWRLDRTLGRFERVLEQGGDLLPAPDGRLWLMSTRNELRLLAGPGKQPARPTVPEALSTGQFAPDGSLWLPGCPDQPCVVPQAAGRADSAFRVRLPAGVQQHARLQMSGASPNTLLVDREGAVWISTEGGLDRLRPKRILPTDLGGEGLGYSLVADAQGRVWAANAVSNAMWRLLPERAVPLRPRHPVTVLARDPAGALLVGGKRSIWRDGPDGAGEIALPPGPGGKPIDMRMLGILDDGKLLWTATLETGLLAWKDGNWIPHSAFRLPAKIYQSALAGPGQLWLATGDGQLFHYDATRDATRAPVDIRALGMTAAIFPEPDPVLSGDNGTGVVRAGALHMLKAADPNVLRNVSGMVTTQDGDRWLNGAAGLVHVTAADWRRSIADPALPLRYEVFDGLDGYPGRAVFESRWRSAASGDGRTLWLIATGGVVRVDTDKLARNPVAPTPVILSLSTGQASFGATAPLRLAPGTERFRIDFTAPALRMPERVRFEYLLEGVDRAWQDAGTRRSTSYTSVAPGRYAFRLRAINEDGVRSTSEAVLPFAVEPALWQTTWFRLLGAALLALLLVLAYRYRVRRLTRRLAERMQVKLAERERIARTLHDSFLQTVQSLMLRVDGIASALPPGDRTRGALEGALRHAGGALGEGRRQLQELRGAGSARLDELLADTVAALQAAHPDIVIGLRSEGAARPIAAETAFEAAAIGREALHNACAHARAGQVRACLDYGAQQLVLKIADDGRGIDEAILQEGAAEGHWGLVGMRERAQRIGARLDIRQGSEGGTVVTLSLPAAPARPE